MNIDLSSFQDETVISISLEGKLEKNNLNINGRKIRFMEPIEYKGQIYRVGKDKQLHLDINYKYEEECGRCLEPFVREESTVLSGKLVEDVGGDCEDEEEELIYHTGDKLNLDKYIMDMVVLSLPMKPLCNIGCKGLCPKCGVNQNKKDCDCDVEDVDPRLAILKDFFPEE